MSRPVRRGPPPLRPPPTPQRQSHPLFVTPNRLPSSVPTASTSTLPSTPATVPASTIVSMLFCASLQSRPSFAPAVSALLASRVEPRWQQANLHSHDLAVRMKLPGREESSSGTGSDVFRFLLVAPSDVGQPETTQRLQRLCQRKVGIGGAVVFLMGGDSSSSTAAAYRQLQVELDTFPILPLLGTEALPTMLAAFCSRIGSPQAPNTAGGDDDLLRYCAAGVPLSEETSRNLRALTMATGSALFHADRTSMSTAQNTAHNMAQNTAQDMAQQRINLADLAAVVHQQQARLVDAFWTTARVHER